MTLRLRISAVLGVFLVANALFVLVLLWAYGVFLPGVVASAIVFVQHGTVSLPFLQLPVSLSVAAVLIVAFLLAQIYYGYRRVLSGTAGGETDHEVTHIVRRLAMTADVPEPDLRVVADDEPSCYTVGRLTDATIVVSTGLIERLDRDELEAVLAHEVAHVANRDVTLMTITTLFVEIADRAYHGARLARRAVVDPDELTDRGRLALVWFLPLVALTYVFVAPLLWAFPTVADWATRTLSYAREFAADAAACELTGNPLALATALCSLAESTTAPERDLRVAKMRALCVVPAEPTRGTAVTSVPAADEPIDDETRREHLSAWLEGQTPATAVGTATHPPVDERVRRLQTIAADLEGQT